MICQRCLGTIPDIGDHFCTTGPNIQPYVPYPLPPMRGQKCDICGSTAIDHTETQCSINRQMNRLSPQKEGKE